MYASSLSGDSDCGHRSWLSNVGSPYESTPVGPLQARSGLTAETGSGLVAADQTLHAPLGSAAGTGVGLAVSGQSADSPGCMPAGSELDPRAGGSRTEGRAPSDGPPAQEPTGERNPTHAAAGHGPRPMTVTPGPRSAGSRQGPGVGNPSEPAPRPVRSGEDFVVLPNPSSTGGRPRTDTGSRGSVFPLSQAPPVDRGVGLGLFTERAASRKRVGVRASDPPPAKRIPAAPSVDAPTARDPDPVVLLRQAARMMGLSLGDGPAGPADFPAEPVRPPAPDGAHRVCPPAAAGAPPWEETFPATGSDPVYLDADTESSFSESVLSAGYGPEPDGSLPRPGDAAQALLRKYLPQVYGTVKTDDEQSEPAASLLFRGRASLPTGIPLTADFQQEYARLSREAKDHTPAALRRAYRFQTADYEKFLSPETLSPEFHRVADKKSRGNPFRTKNYRDQDKKWVRVADLSRTSMRLAAYGGAVANLLARADDLQVSSEDRQALLEVLLDLSEASWSQATRTALYSTRQRRTTALETMGFSHRDADQIGRSIPFEGPHLFAGQAIKIFDEECAYRKRADETAARFLQSRKPRAVQNRGFAATASRPAGRQVTVTLPGPAPATSPARAQTQRQPGHFGSRGARRQGRRGFRPTPRRGGQGF